MAVPRIARIHLVYQFIILTLLIFAIGYNEILPDKKYLFLALIPVFCYQLMIVFCCSELLPIPSWLSLAEQSVEGESSQVSQNSDDSEKMLVANIPSAQNSPNFSKTISPLSLKFSPRNSKTNTENSLAVTGSSEIVATRPEMLKKPFEFCRAEADETETNKGYFPLLQKRSEKWFEPKGNARPYKVRNWKSLHSHKNSKPLSNVKPTSMSVKFQETKQIELNQSNEPNEINDLRKSYSFPFRQRKIENWMESENVENYLNIPIMPPWKNLDYSTSAKLAARKRKSVSTEAIDKQLRLINNKEDELKNKEFTQSLELSGTYNFDDTEIRKNPVKLVTNFDKLKQGIVNCFNRNKKESLKADDAKQTVETKKQFKESFLSKERENSEYERKESSMQSKPPILTKFESRERLCNLPSTYVSFHNDRFVRDEKANFYLKDFDKI